MRGRNLGRSPPGALVRRPRRGCDAAIQSAHLNTRDLFEREPDRGEVLCAAVVQDEEDAVCGAETAHVPVHADVRARLDHLLAAQIRVRRELDLDCDRAREPVAHQEVHALAVERLGLAHDLDLQSPLAEQVLELRRERLLNQFLSVSSLGLSGPVSEEVIGAFSFDPLP